MGLTQSAEGLKEARLASLCEGLLGLSCNLGSSPGLWAFGVESSYRSKVKEGLGEGPEGNQQGPVRHLFQGRP